MICYDAANAKVAKFDPARRIDKNVVKLDIAVQYRPAMTMANTVDNLAKDHLGLIFVDRSALFHERE